MQIPGPSYQAASEPFTGFSTGHTLCVEGGKAVEIGGGRSSLEVPIHPSPINKRPAPALWQAGAVLGIFQQMIFQTPASLPTPSLLLVENETVHCFKILQFYLHKSQTRVTAFKYITSLIRKCTVLLYW